MLMLMLSNQKNVAVVVVGRRWVCSFALLGFEHGFDLLALEMGSVFLLVLT
jgi:hypothetical protein